MWLSDKALTIVNRIEEHGIHDQESNEHDHKVLLVVQSYAVIHPRAMMVHSRHTTATETAMLDTLHFLDEA